jgi:hypothetical protein
MARVARQGLINLPEINLARRVLVKYQIGPPVDIFSLVARYADVEIISIPFAIDGICLDLKVSGRRPRIFLNKDRVETRMRFTLAHELGHVLIPWHMGAIVDIAEERETVVGSDYWVLEAEANRFASELLMPSEWVAELIAESGNPKAIVEKISAIAKVSRQAATIKMATHLPPGYIYVQLDDDIVISSGRSRGTLAGRPPLGGNLRDLPFFNSYEPICHFEAGSRTYVWWLLPRTVDLPQRPTAKKWRALLEIIVRDISIAPEDQKKFKASINGIIAFANGSVRGTDRSPEAIYAACLQRFYSKPGLQRFVSHAAFSEFISNRIDDLLN